MEIFQLGDKAFYLEKFNVEVVGIDSDGVGYLVSIKEDINDSFIYDGHEIELYWSNCVLQHEALIIGERYIWAWPEKLMLDPVNRILRDIKKEIEGK